MIHHSGQSIHSILYQDEFWELLCDYKRKTGKVFALTTINL